MSAESRYTAQDRAAVRPMVDAAQAHLRHWIGRFADKPGVWTVLETLALDALTFSDRPTPLESPRVALEAVVPKGKKP